MRIFKLSFTIIMLLTSSCTVFAQTKIRDVEFRGNSILPEDELMEQVNTLPKTRLEKIMFWKKRPDFIQSVLDEDINRLDSYYNRNGFLNAAVSYKTDTSRSGKLVDVIINIAENQFVKVDSLGVRLFRDTLNQALIDSLKRVIPLKQNQRFTDENIFESEAILKKGFLDNGYPFTKVNHEITLKAENLLSDVVLTVEPGNKSYFGDVKITGNSRVPERFINKYILFNPGEQFKRKKIDKSQQDLFDTDLFQYVVVTALTDSVEGNRIPVSIQLKELPRWKLETGIGYGTEDKLRLSVQVTRLNFLGGTRRVIINGKTSYFMPFSFDVRFVQPDVLIPRLDFIFNPFYRRERETSYRIDRMGGGLSLLYQLSKTLNANITYAFERDRILEIDDLQLDPSELKHNKSIFSLGSQINSTDDLFYPSKGYKLNANISYAGLGLKSELHYYKIDLSLISYFSLSKDLVLASKLRGGVIQTTRTDQRTPIEERFYLGGATSLRGWGRHRISPLSESGFAIGGNTVYEESLELRFPIYDILNGVVFIDAGNVWPGAYHFEFNLHYDAGIGLRVKTPIGPIRLDFASPVINDGFNLQFFISVGHAF